jgi:hypothetical protein
MVMEEGMKGDRAMGGMPGSLVEAFDFCAQTVKPSLAPAAENDGVSAATMKVRRYRIIY